MLFRDGFGTEAAQRIADERRACALVDFSCACTDRDFFFWSRACAVGPSRRRGASSRMPIDERAIVSLVRAWQAGGATVGGRACGCNSAGMRDVGRSRTAQARSSVAPARKGAARAHFPPPLGGWGGASFAGVRQASWPRMRPAAGRRREPAGEFCEGRREAGRLGGRPLRAPPRGQEPSPRPAR